MAIVLNRLFLPKRNIHRLWTSIPYVSPNSLNGKLPSLCFESRLVSFSIIPSWALVAARFRERLVDDRRCLVETKTPVEIKTILIRKAELTRWSRGGISLVSPSKQNLLNQSGMRDREQRKSRADSMSSCPRDDANSRHAFVRRRRMQG